MALNNGLKNYYFLFFQLLRFGIVGVSASIVHFSLVILLVETWQFNPLVANAIAFLFAFQVSYWGHRYWTFSETTALHRDAFPRLFIVASTGFMTNEGLYYIFLTFFKLPYIISLLFVLAIMPLITFTLSKLWVFR